LKHLPEQGYELDAIVLEHTATWAAFTGGAKGILLCDLHSWLPVSLDTLASDMGQSRLPFRYESADIEKLRTRALEDVTLTAFALTHMLEFLQAEGVGKMRPTGSGQSHAAWRRKFLPEKTLLVHDRPAALAHERTAMWAGRAESWRHGEVNGPLYEHDLNLAYCRIAAATPVPVRLKTQLPWVNKKTGCKEIEGLVSLAHVTVKTDQPLVPYGEDERIYWPVGEFTTDLWQPELDLLRDEGADVYIHYGWAYETAPVLAPMAEWLIERLEASADQVSPVVKRLLKHWARTLVGRCALRYRQWEPFGTQPKMELGIWTMIEGEPFNMKEMLSVGHRIMELAEMAESDNSVPQVTGFIMSQARADLWRLMQVAGTDNLVYVDTDSLLVNAKGHAKLRGVAEESSHTVLTHKATWAKAEVTGPRNLVLESDRKIAGVPRRAVRIGDHVFEGEVWAGIKTSLSGRQLDNVAVQKRLFEVTALDQRRRHLPDGTTRPIEVQDETTD